MPTAPKTDPKLRDFAYFEKLVKGPAVTADSKGKLARGRKAFDVTNAMAPKMLVALENRLKNEQLVRAAYINSLARAAFGTEKLAAKFFKNKHPKLKATPLQKLETEWGGRQVERILNSMIYGLAA